MCWQRCRCCWPNSYHPTSKRSNEPPPRQRSIVAKETGLGPERISTVVREGSIDHEIIEEATATKADLIVMSSHRKGMRTYFLGSNTGYVVRYATCSVLVVRQQLD
jgi:nucleotide-binding universal stress UspA family protein